MDRPGKIQITYIPQQNCWKYEHVYMDTGTHKGNIDIFYYRDGVLIEQEINLHHAMIPDHPNYDFAIRIHSQ